MLRKRSLSLILLFSLLLTAASCGGTETPVNDNTQTTAADTTEAAAPYPYPTKDLGGMTFKVLNLDEQ